MQKCEAKTKTGAACRAPAGAKGLCFLHANPGIATSLGRRGGQKNRRSPINLEIPDNMTAADIRKVTVQVIRLVLSDELGAREAGAVTQLLNSLHRVTPTAELEARVALLEEQLRQEENGAQDVDPIGSPTNETGADAETDLLLPAEPNPCPTDAQTPSWSDGGDEAGSRSDEPDEAAQEENVVPPEVDPTGLLTNETEADAESDVLAAEQTLCPTDADTPGWTDGEDGAESRSDEPDEAGEA
jgi:hypothetical protein